MRRARRRAPRHQEPELPRPDDDPRLERPEEPPLDELEEGFGLRGMTLV